MDAFILELNDEKLIPLTLESPKLMLSIMDRPLLEHIRDMLSKCGIYNLTLLTDKTLSLFPDKYFKEKISVSGYKEVEAFLKNREGYILFTRPFISDISLDRIINSKKAYVTHLYNKGMSTGIYIVTRAESEPERYDTQGYFSFLSTAEEYISCHRDILKGKLSVKTEYNFKNRGVILGENSLLEIGSLVNPPVYIGKGTVVSRGAKIGAYSVIGSDCIISSGGKIEGGVINKGCFLGKNCEVKAAVISSSVRINERAVIEKAVCIGEGSVVGADAVIGKGVRIWNKKIIPDGERVIKDVESGRDFSPLVFENSKAIGSQGTAFTPEDAVLLGACFSRRNPYLRISVASDSSPYAVMIKSALISGIMSAGGEVLDMGIAVRPALRFSITENKSAGGVYVSDSVSFYGKDSFYIKEKDFGFLKNAYDGIKFARLDKDNVKPLSDVKMLSEAYYEKMCSLCMENKKHMGYVYYDSKNPECMKYAERLGGSALIKKLSHRTDGYISGIFGRAGNLISISDEDGRVLSTADFLKTISFIIDRYEKRKVFVLRKKLSHLKSSVKMETILCDDENYMRSVMEKGSRTQYLMESDGVFAFFKICSFLFSEKIQLKDLLVFF